MILKPRISLQLLLGLPLLLGSFTISPGLARNEADSTLGLVQITPGSESDLADLALSGLTLYEKLYTTRGVLTLIAAASQPVQANLIQRGIKVEVLDPDMSGANYSLLYGTPQALEQARELTRVLLVEGSQGIARTTEVQPGRLAALGLEIAPLAPRAFIPVSQMPRVAALPEAISIDPLILEMVNQVDQQTLFNLVGGLSGEWPVTVSGAPYVLSTRYSYTTIPTNKATRYAYEFFNSHDLLTWYDYYSLVGLEKRSVIAQQTGLYQPDKVFLLTAHLDDTSHVNGDPFEFAPGADDNASGSAALLQIAKILSQYDFGCTLRYALFTGEEQGLYGSKAYAADIYHQGENLQAVLNLDMLGYNTPSSPAVIELHTRWNNSGDLGIANLFRDVLSAYGFTLIPSILQDGKTFSDHSSFWDYGYPALLAIEDWNDHTPNYHMTGDQLETLNFGYYLEFVKTALATFAHMGCLPEGRLSGTIRDSLSSDPIPGASVAAEQYGFQVSSSSAMPNGNYQLALQPGLYTIRFSAADHLEAVFLDTSIQQNQSTTINPFLIPCVFVRETQISISSSTPGAGEPVSFNATAGAGDPPISFAWDFGDGSTSSSAVVSHAFGKPGSYLVKLTADNPCGVSQTVAAMIFVDVELIFLPITTEAGIP